MSIFNRAFAFFALAFVLAGCNSKAVESASHKSLIADGYIALNKITVTDTATQSYTPQLFSLFMSGKYISLLKDTSAIMYDKKSNASIFNSQAITTEETLVIQSRDGKLAEIIAELGKLKTPETATSATTAE